MGDDDKGGVRILLVVDLETRRFLAQCLSDYEVLHANDYGQAINVMLSRLMKLVISERALPKIGGVEVLSAASQLQPQAKRVLVGEAPENLGDLISQGIVHVHVPNPFVTSMVYLLNALVQKTRTCTTETAHDQPSGRNRKDVTNE